MRLKFIRRDCGSFSGGLLPFYLSAAVIALNAFWRCVQLRDYGKFDNVADVDA